MVSSGVFLGDSRYDIWVRQIFRRLRDSGQRNAGVAERAIGKTRNVLQDVPPGTGREVPLRDDEWDSGVT